MRLRASLRHVVRDTGWVGLGELIGLAAGLVTLNVLLIGLGPDGYGRLVALQAMSSTLTWLSCGWIIMVLFQHAVQVRLSLREAFASSFGAALSASTVALGVGTVLGATLLPGVPMWLSAAFIGGELAAAVLIGLPSAAVQLAQGMPAATKIRTLLPLTRMLVVLALAALGPIQLGALALGLLVAYALLGTATLLWTSRRLGLSLLPQRPRKRDVRDGLPHAGVMGSLALLEDSDKIFMTRFADPVDAGLYAASYRLVSLGLIPVKALVNSSHPRFLVDTPGARTEHLTRALRFTAPAAAYTLVATAGIVLIAPVVPRLLGGEYAGTAAIMVMLAPLVLFRSLALFPLNALLGLARYRMRLLVIFGCAVLNVGLNLVLVPRWSYHGAIVSTLVSEVVFFVAAWTCVAVAQRQHDQRRSADEGGGPEELADGGSQSARPR